MSEPKAQKSRLVMLNNSIDYESNSIAKIDPLALPLPESKLTQLYIEKIKNTYNISRVPQDTSAAIDLLYISYNATPQEESEIRNKITDIINDLEKALDDASLAMLGAASGANRVLNRIKESFPDWLIDRKPDSKTGLLDLKKTKEYYKDDFVAIAKAINKEATKLADELKKVSKQYDDIINKINDTTKLSETVLGKRIKDEKQLKKDLISMKSDQAALEVSISVLKGYVEKYNKLSESFEKQATRAEDRAFVLSLVQIGAQAIAAAIPPIAAAATASSTGGASVIAAGALNASTHGEKDSATNADDHGEIQKTHDIMDKEKELNVVGAEIKELNKRIAELESDLNKEKDDAKNPQSISNIESEISKKKDILEKKKKARTTLTTSIAALHDALKATDEKMSKFIENTKSTASSLRELQMKMLDKAEEYEKDRMKQNSELTKINVLLKGKLDEQDTLQLTVRSLNLSIVAIHRAKQIIDEISVFFQNFVLFIQSQIDDNSRTLEYFEESLAKENIRESRLENLKLNADIFFIKRQAEWLAISVVAEIVESSFSTNSKQLKALQGNYLHDKDLTIFLESAAQRIEKIVADQNKKSDAKILDLDESRKEIRFGTAA